MIYLVFCLVFTFTPMSTGQNTSTGTFGCPNDSSLIGIEKFKECNNPSYISSVQVQMYGVDCCITEARYNMNSFYRISKSISKELNATVTVSYPKSNVNIIFIVIAER